MKELKEKEYEISLKTVKENIVKVSAISRDEALKSAEDLVLAPDYEKMKNTKNTRTYVVVDLVEKKPRFCKKSNGFVFLKK